MLYLAWAFWWVDVCISIATCVGLPFIIMQQHKPKHQSITAALLLPVVPPVVAASTGGLLAEALPDNAHAFTTLIVSYVLWGIGEFYTACVMTLYFHRLTVHSLPPREVIVSVFLPVGPLGLGGFGIQQLGKVAVRVLPGTTVFKAAGVDAARGSEMLYVLGIFLGLIMWGFSLVWLALALLSIVATRKFPFNESWWGATFPVGVLAACTGLLAENLDSEFFRILTMVGAL